MLNLPQYICKILYTIEAAGYEAYCVGGCVRDMLLGSVPHDYDVATNAPVERLSELFERTVPTGLKHGTVTVVTDEAAVEVTHYRIDGDYSDGRRPNSVEFTDDFTLDLSRRDFTVNAMGYHPTRGLVDVFGGKEDLAAHTIRAVGDPDCRFSEDALRILRAIRFASTLGFDIEPATLQAAKRLAGRLTCVSVERICSEVMRTLGGRRPALLAEVINSGGLKHLGLVGGDLKPLDRMDCSPAVRLAALLKLCGGNADTCTALKCDNKTRATAAAALKQFAAPLPRTDAELRRLLQQCESDAADILTAQGALMDADVAPQLRQLDAIIARVDPYRTDMLAVGGQDMLALGIRGTEIGRTLLHLLDMVIEQPQLNTVEQLTALARQFTK